jgi:hypothetical protein
MCARKGAHLYIHKYIDRGALQESLQAVFDRAACMHGRQPVRARQFCK